MTMKVVPPIDITPDKLVSNNVPETDYPEWVSSTTPLSAGTRRIIAAQHTIYETLGSTTDSPLDGIAKTTPTWMVVSPTNRWKMFIKKPNGSNIWQIGTSTINPTSIQFRLTPGAIINSLGLVKVKGSTVRIRMYTTGTDNVLYEKTISLSRKIGGSWYKYYYGGFDTIENSAIFDLPTLTGVDVEVLVSAPGGTAEIGMMVIGVSKDVGYMAYGSQIGNESYSIIDEDEFGNITVTPRGSRETIDFDVVVMNDQISATRRTLAGLQNIPSLYAGEDSLDYTIIIGLYERLAMVLPNYGSANYTLAVRSVS